MRSLLVCLIGCGLGGCVAAEHSTGARRTAADADRGFAPQGLTWLHFDRDRWEQARRSFLHGREPSDWARPRLDQADHYLRTPAVSIVAGKLHLPASGDPHDYHSLAIYWWPNPLTGRPYIHRDGYRNPEASEYDAPKLDLATRRIELLTFAWYATRRQAYAEAATDQVRAFFLDPSTRMSPHLEHAQFMPGWNDGSRVGIIEGLPLATRVIPAAVLLEESGELTPSDEASLRAWFAQYAEWLQTSPFGRAEAARPNNHATWHAVQLATCALYGGDVRLAEQVVARARERLTQQILPDGTQPEELRRSRSMSYSLYNLRGWITLARIGDALGADLWRHPPDKPRIPAAVRYLTENERSWPHPQLGRWNRDLLTELAREAGVSHR